MRKGRVWRMRRPLCSVTFIRFHLDDSPLFVHIDEHPISCQAFGQMSPPLDAFLLISPPPRLARAVHWLLFLTLSLKTRQEATEGRKSPFELTVLGIQFIMTGKALKKGRLKPIASAVSATRKLRNLKACPYLGTRCSST